MKKKPKPKVSKPKPKKFQGVSKPLVYGPVANPVPGKSDPSEKCKGC